MIFIDGHLNIELILNVEVVYSVIARSKCIYACEYSWFCCVFGVHVKAFVCEFCLLW